MVSCRLLTITIFLELLAAPDLILPMARRAGSKMKQAPAHKGLPEEMEDEIDAFHKSKDIVSLDPEAATSVSHSTGPATLQENFLHCSSALPAPAGL